MQEIIRLDRFLSDMGIDARKEIKKIIKSGRVSVAGKVVTVPDFKFDENTASVFLDGEMLSYRRFRYFMLDKPKGILTASKDKGTMTVLDIIPDEYKKLGLFPVGRLDKDTSGLLLLTNDGEFAHKVISPKYEIEKKYYAITAGEPNEKAVRAFKEGIQLRDGLECLPALLEPLGEGKCYVTVKEGKYHQVRRMLASVGCHVLELRRLSIGGLKLAENSAEGSISELSQRELDMVFENNGQKQP